jgi:hypothetical protein
MGPGGVDPLTPTGVGLTVHRSHSRPRNRMCFPLGMPSSFPIPKLRWQGGQRFVPDPGDRAVSVEVADSWLVEEGRGRGLDRHRERFTGSCPDPGRADIFFGEVLAAIPRTGRWFPRVEWHLGEFRLWLRPAPPRSATVSLWVPDRPDPRVHPSVKGPDLAALSALRSEAADMGFGEAVLVSPEGWVREGALSALMWWREDLLCTSPEGPGLLPSVTRRLVLMLAQQQGQRVRLERVRPGELMDLECWSMSALHGIRAVTGRNRAPARRAQQWQEVLLSLAEPLPPP